MGNGRIKVGPGVTIYRQWRAWWIDSRGGGERMRRSLHTQDQSEAIQKALDILNCRTSPPRKVETLQEILDRYMREHSALHHRPSTGKRYRSVIQQFIDGVGSAELPKRIVRADLLAFQKARSAKVRAETVNGDVGYIKAFVNWCRAEGMIDGDPCFKVTRLKVNRTRRRRLTPEEFAQIAKRMRRAPFLADYAMVGANTGMRPSRTGTRAP